MLCSVYKRVISENQAIHTAKQSLYRSSAATVVKWAILSMNAIDLRWKIQSTMHNAIQPRGSPNEFNKKFQSPKRNIALDLNLNMVIHSLLNPRATKLPAETMTGIFTETRRMFLATLALLHLHAAMTVIISLLRTTRITKRLMIMVIDETTMESRNLIDRSPSANEMVGSAYR